jgi:hypothetical protein
MIGGNSRASLMLNGPPQNENADAPNYVSEKRLTGNGER